MKNMISSKKIIVGKSQIPNAGRGVFALRNIKKGENVESCPILEIPQYEMEYFKESILITYLFYFGKKKERAAFALGFGSIYNHSDKPNVSFKIKPEKELIEFTALVDIKKGEELTFNYRGGKNDKKKLPLWFEQTKKILKS